MQKWLVVVPEKGAARVVAEQVYQAFCTQISPSQVILFDTLQHIQFWEKSLNAQSQDFSVDLMNQQLVQKCLENSVTHVLVGALSAVFTQSLDLLKKLGIYRVHWFYEDAYEALYWKDVYLSYDRFLHVQGPAFSEKLGECAYHLDTAAVQVIPNQNSFLEREFDVGFVGIPTAYRIEVLERLYRSGVKLAICGLGWNQYLGPLKSQIFKGTWVNADENREWMQRCKAGLNLSQNNPLLASHSDVNWRQISPRVWDLAAWGVLPIVEDVPLAQNYISEIQCVAFSQTSQLDDLHKIMDLDWQNSLEQNQSLILKKHLYIHRVREIMGLS